MKQVCIIPKDSSIKEGYWNINIVFESRVIAFNDFEGVVWLICYLLPESSSFQYLLKVKAVFKGNLAFSLLLYPGIWNRM
jgi:hypothetical protein